MIWTTNFDPLIADACAETYKTTGALTTVDLDAPSRAHEAIVAERWPVEIKLHGDFRSRRLKNTPDELRSQDADLRNVLIDCCKSFVLIVVGYSGRDDSIMNSLETAIQQPGAFPGGMFWLNCGENPPVGRVGRLLLEAREKNIEGGIVPIENFDEALLDLIRLCDDVDTTEVNELAYRRRIWSRAPAIAGRRGWPVVRLNALPITQRPSICRRVVCNIGGTAEVRDAIARTGANVIAVRSQAGVLAFGSDVDIKTVFEPYGIDEYDIYTLETWRLMQDTTQRGLLSEALIKALPRQYNLDLFWRGGSNFLAPSNPNSEEWTRLRSIVGSVGGVVGRDGELRWREGISFRLDWAAKGLWLLFQPTTVFDEVSDYNKATASDFGRARTIDRYNRKLNSLFDFWANYLVREDTLELRALGVADGIDAVFHLAQPTAFSYRSGA